MTAHIRSHANTIYLTMKRPYVLVLKERGAWFCKKPVQSITNSSLPFCSESFHVARHVKRHFHTVLIGRLSPAITAASQFHPGKKGSNAATACLVQELCSENIIHSVFTRAPLVINRKCLWGISFSAFTLCLTALERIRRINMLTFLLIRLRKYLFSD